MRTLTLPPLPPGFAPAEPPRPTAAEPAPRRPVDSPPLSGVLTTVTARTGADVTLHRWDYQRATPHGGFIIHGYAWRCTACSRLSPGYEPCEFAAALGDARDHQCEVPR